MSTTPQNQKMQETFTRNLIKQLKTLTDQELLGIYADAMTLREQRRMELSKYSLEAQKATIDELGVTSTPEPEVEEEEE